MQVPSSLKNKQGLISTLSTLFQRHLNAAQHYRRMLEETDGPDSLTTLIDSLAAFHQKQADAAAEMVRDMPATPVKPNQMMLSGKGHHYSVPFEDLDKPISYYRYIHEEESKLARDYAQLLDNPDIPEPIHERIQEQHQLVLANANKVSRLLKTGEDREML